MVSIIIPAYNEEKYLPDLLECLEQQTLPKDQYEVIVADAQSTDRTRDIALAAGAKVVEGGIPSVGRNRGVHASKGEILIFLDADVKGLEPSFLEEALAIFKKRNIDILYPQYATTGLSFASKLLYMFMNFSRSMASIMGQANASGQCMVLKRSVFTKINGFDESLPVAEDVDFLHRAKRDASATYHITSKVLYLPSDRRFLRKGRVRVLFAYTVQGMAAVFFPSLLKQHMKRVVKLFGDWGHDDLT